MIDTFAIVQVFARPPDEHFLLSNGWLNLYKPNGEFSRYAFNQVGCTGAPRLTLYQDYQQFWRLKAELSLFAWLYGSNVDLPSEIELKNGLPLLSEFVSDYSGFKFDAPQAKVSKVDFARNIKVEDHMITPILSNLGKLEIPKYNCQRYPTTVYFKNAGRSKNKQAKIYDKHQETKDKKKPLHIQKSAENIVRIEISHTNKAVYNLAKSLKIPNKASRLLTETVSSIVITDWMNRLNFEQLLNGNFNKVENLFNQYNPTTAKKLVAFLNLQSIYGKDLHRVEFLDYTQRTCQKYRRDCKRAGVISSV